MNASAATTSPLRPVSAGPAKREREGKLDLRFSPTGTDRFLLGAEPAFPFDDADFGCVVVALSRHMLDALATGTDVALNSAHTRLALRQVWRELPGVDKADGDHCDRDDGQPANSSLVQCR